MTKSKCSYVFGLFAFIYIPGCDPDKNLETGWCREMAKRTSAMGHAENNAKKKCEREKRENKKRRKNEKRSKIEKRKRRRRRKRKKFLGLLGYVFILGRTIAGVRKSLMTSGMVSGAWAMTTTSTLWNSALRRRDRPASWWSIINGFSERIGNYILCWFKVKKENISSGSNLAIHNLVQI